MDLDRIKELAGAATLTEVSDALVRSTLQRRQAAAHAASDRYNTANQTPASEERSKNARDQAVEKLGGSYDAAAARLQRRERLRKRQLSAQAMEALRLAGIPLEEAYDDDDEDPDVKIANADKRQREFEKKNSKAIKAAEKVADKGDEKEEAAATKKATADDEDEPKAAEKAPTEKKEEAKTAAAKGRKPSERTGTCRSWLEAHPGATRAQFVAHCLELGMTKNHANTSFYTLRNKIAASTNEAFMIVHPLDSGTVLAENTRLRRYEWIDICEHNDYVSPMVFSSLFEAEAIVSGMGLMSQAGVATQIDDDGKAVA